MFKSRQELFETAITHVVKQGEPAVELDEMHILCRYRTGKLACAIGALIPDDVYSEELESKTVGQLLMRENQTEKFRNWLRDNPVFAESKHLLGETQVKCHDAKWKSVEQYIGNVKEIALKYNLNTDFLEKLNFDKMRTYIANANKD